MPPILIVLAVIALVLHILFGYLLPPPGVNMTTTGRFLTALLVIILILLFWFVLPLRIG